MKIETKYSLGDGVWKIAQNKPKVWRKCSFCVGSKEPRSQFAINIKITGLDGSERACPECRGDGGRYEYLELSWLVKEALTIGQVEIRVSSKEAKEAYMCAETGIGGGTIHYVDTLYPTKKEAQAECDRRNSESQ